MKRWLAVIGWLSLLATASQAGDDSRAYAAVDYAKIDRHIAKEPHYLAQPLYALFVLDPAGKVRVWAVLDKSKPDAPYYDVLYFDRTGDGDLTDPSKRFTGTFDTTLKDLVIPVGKLPVPGTKLVHTDLRFLTAGGPHKYRGFHFSMKWDGIEPVEGGYKGFGDDLTTYATSPQLAPVLRPTPLGPLAFVVFTERELRIGKNEMLQLGVGNAGSGPDTFCVVSEDFLQPGKDRLFVSLIARDKSGKELRQSTEIKEHC